jgi:membrane-bound lytic murein transglycosylase D
MLDRKLASNDADVLLPGDLRGLSGGESSKNLRHDMWTDDENLLGFLPKPKRKSLRSAANEPSAPEPSESADDAIAAEFAPRRSDRETVMYRVGSGDSLIGIAKQFAVDVEDLARDNSIEPDGMLREGALLKILVKPEVLEGWKKGKQAKASKTRTGRKRG